MRGEEDRMLADDVMRAALGRKGNWERHGSGHWGYGVALDMLALERRVAALERTKHDAAPAARAQFPTGGHASGGSDSVGNDRAEPLTRLGTGDTQEEPLAFAVMSGGRAYDIYDTRGEAEAICRWLREEESGDIWRVVPLVPATLTDDDRVAIELAAGDCLYHQDPGGRAQWIREQLLGLLVRTR